MLIYCRCNDFVLSLIVFSYLFTIFFFGLNKRENQLIVCSVV
jgi:hypothetical protein